MRSGLIRGLVPALPKGASIAGIWVPPMARKEIQEGSDRYSQDVGSVVGLGAGGAMDLCLAGYPRQVAGL